MQLLYENRCIPPHLISHIENNKALHPFFGMTFKGIKHIYKKNEV